MTDLTFIFWFAIVAFGAAALLLGLSAVCTCILSGRVEHSEKRQRRTSV